MPSAEWKAKREPWIGFELVDAETLRAESHVPIEELLGAPGVEPFTRTKDGVSVDVIRIPHELRAIACGNAWIAQGLQNAIRFYQEDESTDREFFFRGRIRRYLREGHSFASSLPFWRVEDELRRIAATHTSAGPANYISARDLGTNTRLIGPPHQRPRKKWEGPITTVLELLATLPDDAGPDAVWAALALTRRV